MHHLTKFLEPGLDVPPNLRLLALRHSGGKAFLEVFLNHFEENMEICLLVNEQISPISCHSSVENFYCRL